MRDDKMRLNYISTGTFHICSNCELELAGHEVINVKMGRIGFSLCMVCAKIYQDKLDLLMEGTRYESGA